MSCTVRKDVLEYMKLKLPMILCHVILTFLSMSGVCMCAPRPLQMSLPSASAPLYLTYLPTPPQISNYVCTNVATEFQKVYEEFSCFYLMNICPF